MSKKASRKKIKSTPSFRLTREKSVHDFRTKKYKRSKKAKDKSIKESYRRANASVKKVRQGSRIRVLKGTFNEETKCKDDDRACKTKKKIFDLDKQISHRKKYSSSVNTYRVSPGAYDCTKLHCSKLAKNEPAQALCRKLQSMCVNNLERYNKTDGSGGKAQDRFVYV